MIRKATPDDLIAIVDLGIEALEKSDHPDMVISRARVEEVARQCVTSPANFAWVAERDGEVGGSVCAIVHPCMFYDRMQATVVQYYSKIPGDGEKLIRELIRWWRSRPVLKMLIFTLEYDTDPRVGDLLGRMGLCREQPAYVISSKGDNHE